jgi:protein SCO1
VQYGRGFELKSPDGKVRRLSDFKGKVVLLIFGFTQCPDICPTALSRAATSRALLGRQAEQLQVLFVTVDPERDTPELLSQFTTAFHPDFLGLHGDAQQVSTVSKEFKIHYEKVPTGSSYTMDHSTVSYLFDMNGHMRLAVPHGQSADALAEDIKALLRS